MLSTTVVAAWLAISVAMVGLHAIIDGIIDEFSKAAILASLAEGRVLFHDSWTYPQRTGTEWWNRLILTWFH